jgi:hypothetical protein
LRSARLGGVSKSMALLAELSVTPGSVKCPG